MEKFTPKTKPPYGLRYNINNETTPYRDMSDIRLHVMHHTGINARDQNMELSLIRKDYINVHFLILKTGEIVQLVDLNRVAYHAGVSSWGNIPTVGNSLNYCSVGTEIHSNGYDFTREQKEAARWLAQELNKVFGISKKNTVRHADVAPGRKWDVGESFYKDEFKTWEDYQNSLTENAMLTLSDEQQKVTFTKAMNAAAESLSSAWNTAMNPETQKKIEQLKKEIDDARDNDLKNPYGK